jgi:TPR repeat protein
MLEFLVLQEYWQLHEDLITNKHHTKDFERLEQLREAQLNPASLLILTGLCYLRGYQVTVDYVTAQTYFKQALKAKQGPETMAALGEYYYKQPEADRADHTLTAYFLLAAAEEGSTTSYYSALKRDLSALFNKINSLNSNFITARAICNLSNHIDEQDSPSTQQQDIDNLIEMAKSKDSARARLALFHIYRKGRGLRKDPQRAIRYLCECIKASFDNPEWLAILPTALDDDMPKLAVELLTKTLSTNNRAAVMHADIMSNNASFLYQALSRVNEISEKEFKAWEKYGLEFSEASSSSKTKPQSAKVRLENFKFQLKASLIEAFIVTPEQKQAWDVFEQLNLTESQKKDNNMPASFDHLSTHKLLDIIKEAGNSEAFNALLERAKRPISKEDRSSQYIYHYIGNCYFKGNGTPRDYQEAEKYYLLAAQQHDCLSMYNLGIGYLNGYFTDEVPDLAAAAYWFLKAARYNRNRQFSSDILIAERLDNTLSVADGKAALGICYLQGYEQGPIQNTVLAIQLLKEAAAQGSALAMLGLFTAHKSGLGVDFNPALAIDYLFQAFEASINNPAWLSVLASSFPTGLPFFENLFKLALANEGKINDKAGFFLEALGCLKDFDENEFEQWSKKGIVLFDTDGINSKEAFLKHQQILQEKLIKVLVKALGNNEADKKQLSPYIYSMIIGGNIDAALTLMQSGVLSTDENESKQKIMRAIAITQSLSIEQIHYIMLCLSHEYISNIEQIDSLSEDEANLALQQKIAAEPAFWDDMIFSGKPNPIELAVQSRNITAILGFLVKLGLIDDYIIRSEIQFNIYKNNLKAYLHGVKDEDIKFTINKDNQDKLNDLVMAVGDAAVFFRKIESLKADLNENNIRSVIAICSHMAETEYFDDVERAKAYRELVALAEDPAASVDAVYCAAKCLEFGYGVAADPLAAKVLYEKAKEQDPDFFNQKTDLRYQDIIEPLYRKAYDDEDKEAFSKLVVLAEHDHPDDGYIASKIGTCYYNGRGTAKNHNDAFKYYSRAHAKGNRAALHNLGLYYYNCNNQREAFKYWLEALNKGDEVTLDFLTKLSEKNDPLANFILSTYYFDNAPEKFTNAHWMVFKDITNAYNDNYRRLRNNFKGRASYYLAKSYQNGQGTSCNLAKAIDNYSAALYHNFQTEEILTTVNALAEQEDLTEDVKQSLGKFFKEQGTRAPRSSALMLQHYLRATTYGYYGYKYFNLPRIIAVIYYHGYTTEKDMEKAAVWKLKATALLQYDKEDTQDLVKELKAWYSETESPHFAAALGIYCLKASGYNRGGNAASSWLKKPGVKETELGCYGLALFAHLKSNAEVGDQKNRALEAAIHNYFIAAKYNSGISVGGGALSIQALELLAEQDQPYKTQAMLNIAECYQNGYSVAVDHNKAFTLFEQLAKAGMPDAMLQLANCYVDGKGCEKDLKLALQWCFKALQDMPTVDFNFITLVRTIVNSPEFTPELVQFTLGELEDYHRLLANHIKNLSPQTFLLMEPLVKIVCLAEHSENTLCSHFIYQTFSALNQPKLLQDKLDNFSILGVPAVSCGSKTSQADINALQLSALQSFLKTYVLMQLLPEITAADRKELQSLLIGSIGTNNDDCALMLIKAGVSPLYESGAGNNFLHLIANKSELSIAKTNEYLQAIKQWATQNDMAEDWLTIELLKNNSSNVSPFEVAATQGNYAIVAAFLFHLGWIDSLDIDLEEVPVRLGNLYNSDGEYLPNDIEKAKMFYERAANNGHGRAMLKLAACYLQEPGVDKKLAIRWYLLAAQGNKQLPEIRERAIAELLPLIAGYLQEPDADKELAARWYISVAQGNLQLPEAREQALRALEILAQAEPASQVAKEYLMKSDPDLKLRANMLLFDSLTQGNFQQAKALIMSGASLMYMDENNNNIFHVLAMKKDLSNLEIDEFFNVVDKWLAVSNKSDQADAIYYAQLTAKNRAEIPQTPLMVAEQHNPRFLKELLKKLNWRKLHLSVFMQREAEVNDCMSSEEKWHKDILGNTPMQLAVELNDWECAMAAFPGMPLSMENVDGCNILGKILRAAVYAGQIRATEKLLNLNASTYLEKAMPDGRYLTAPLLHVAIDNCDIEMIKLLLKYVATNKIHLSAKNGRGLTALDFVDIKRAQLQKQKDEIRTNPSYDAEGKYSKASQEAYDALSTKIDDLLPEIKALIGAAMKSQEDAAELNKSPAEPSAGSSVSRFFKNVVVVFSGGPKVPAPFNDDSFNI